VRLRTRESTFDAAMQTGRPAGVVVSADEEGGARERFMMRELT
jgi:hypothetical protein